MAKCSFWQREHSGKRTTARLDGLGGALSDRPIELLRVRRRRRLDLRCRPISDSGRRPLLGISSNPKFATMHIVSNIERIRQLNALASAVQALLPALDGVQVLRGSIPAFERCLAETTRLLEHGFVQDDLSSLSRAVPKLFWLHKEWTPQLERRADGSYVEPSWFNAVDRLHQEVQDAAEELRVVGRY